MCGHNSACIGCDNAFGKTSEQMQDPNTFLSAGWDFVGEFVNGANEVWRLCSGEAEYPVLAWQLPLGDFDCPSGVEKNDLGYLCDEWMMSKVVFDVAPLGGDYYVDFLDWTVFAAAWRSQSGQPAFNPLCDVIADGTIDEYDLFIFLDEWLKLGDKILLADIYPQPEGNDVVDIYDFALFAQQWMAE